MLRPCTAYYCLLALAMLNVHMGTCSWKYESWENLIYQKGSNDSYLKQYALQYDTVEIDQWFWSLGKEGYGLPDPKVVTSYDEDTPSTFRFTIKCPNALTLFYAYGSKHEKNTWFLDAELMYRFLDRLSPIALKIGCLMFQFGYLNKKMFPDRHLFYDMLHHFFQALPDSVSYAVELRNPSWLDHEWFTFLSDHKVSAVLLDGYWMEPVSHLLSTYAPLLGSPLVLRLHGDDRSFIEAKTEEHWNTLVLPKDSELVKIAPQLIRLAQMGKVIYVNVNNHYEGSAPLTINKLVKLLSDEEKNVYE